MSKKYDIKFAAREYEVKGEKKTYWSSHGTLFIEDNGKIKITITIKGASFSNLES